MVFIINNTIEKIENFKKKLSLKPTGMQVRLLFIAIKNTENARFMHGRRKA